MTFVHNDNSLSLLIRHQLIFLCRKVYFFLLILKRFILVVEPCKNDIISIKNYNFNNYEKNYEH